jgi:hypothetical protein
VAKSIDSNSAPRCEPGKESAELPGALWEGETEIPRRLGNPLPAARGYGWLATSVAVGSACLVLAVGGIVAWQNPKLQTATRPQSGQTLSPPSDQSTATRRVPIERPDRDAPQQASTERGSGSLRQLIVTPANTAATESPTNESQPLGDDKQLVPPSPTLEETGGATKSRAAYRWAINRARSAFMGRDLKRAKRQLELATGQADLPSQKVQVAQFRALETQLVRFWSAVRAGLETLEPAEELHIGNAIAAVVESGPDSLALFVTGSRRDYTLANLPTKVALFVAQRGANEDAPASQVCWGAFHAVDPRGDRSRARQLWESAAAAGEPVGLLLPFLEPRALAIDRESIPDTLELAPAEAAIEQKFADAIEAAKSAQRKSRLAADLISSAADAETLLEHYALLTQAARWAIAAAEPQAALQAIDERARWFEVDLWTLKSEALAKATAASSSPASAREIATIALELSEEAEVLSLSEQAESLAATAQAAARKARDRDLVKKSEKRRREVEKLGKSPAKKPSASE